MTSHQTGAGNILFKDWMKGGLATLILTVLFLLYTVGKSTAFELLYALPFFMAFNFALFTIGWEPVIRSIQTWIGKNRFNVLIFPTVMLLLYVIYLYYSNQSLVSGNPWLLVYTMYFPVVVFALVHDPGRKPCWIDFTVFVLTLLPSALFNVKQNSELPISGGGFDSLSHIMVILTGVYAFAVVRNIKDVGFTPELKWKSLVTALLVWAGYYLFVFIFGSSVNFIAVIGYDKTFGLLVKSVLFTMIGTFLHTALFEELFFRGILQNMLAKRIELGKSWFIFWVSGFVLLLIAALAVGYTLEGKMPWWPALVTVSMFVAAWFLEKSGKHGIGAYTSLAITGVTFGLVHYHARSIIYIGLACLAGWAYGYTYMKTRNVFYSALVHTLVNTGVLIFGLKMIR
jgi:membrane protease YdiL (CAAX protease family)